MTTPSAHPPASSLHTVRLHRVFRAPPERVYRAFLDPAAMCKWLPPHGFTATMHSMDAKVGGAYRMSFTNFGTGQTHTFGGTYKELTPPTAASPNGTMRYGDKFEDPSMPGEMNVTVDFKKVLCGTDLSIVQDNIPPQIPVEMCYLGWQESLSLLKMLVEAEIP